ERTETPLPSADIWYIHTVLTQCFLPYKDPKTDRWRRQNGTFSISLIAGDIKDPTTPEGMRVAGLPFGAKPRLFQSYLCTQAIKQQSPVIAVERSMTATYYYSLKDHAVPYDFRALRAIQNKPKAQDMYLWMTQRLCRIPSNKPVRLRWQDLYDMFGGQSTLKEFKRKFPADLAAARA